MDSNKETVFRWLKKKSIGDWLEVSAVHGDTWEEWVQSSIDELNKGRESLILFGPEVIFIMEWLQILSPDDIIKLLLEFYNKELKDIKNGRE